MGPEERGEAAMVTAAAAFWAHLAILGTPAALLYFVSNRHLDSRRMLKMLSWPMFWQATVCGVLACVTFVVLTDFGRTVNYFWVELFFIMVGIYLFNTGSLCLAALQGEHRFTAFAVVNALPILIYALLVAVLFFSGWGNIPLYLTASSVGWAMVPVATWVSLRQSTHRRHLMTSRPCREVRKYGAKSAIATAAPTDQFGIEQLIVGSMIGHKALGLWTAGWAFETATVLPGNLLAGFVAPVVACRRPESKEEDDLEVDHRSRWWPRS
ncbi:MAG: oligosaccharide flippase family protein [Marmoricola sp.]